MFLTDPLRPGRIGFASAPKGFGRSELTAPRFGIFLLMPWSSDALAAVWLAGPEACLQSCETGMDGSLAARSPGHVTDVPVHRL